jgi:hypothetical protein
MTPEPPRRAVVVVGGTGVFGRRLAEGLLARTGCDVVLAGRDAGRAAAATLAEGYGAGRVRGVALDARRPSAEALRALGAFAVADAAGPFQEGGGYALARAALAAGAHHVDLADARGHVAGFAAALDADARTAGGVALTGASSPPASRTRRWIGSRGAGARSRRWRSRSAPATARRAAAPWCGRSCPGPAGRCGSGAMGSGRRGPAGA